MATGFLFPGQGSQKVGMGKDFYEKSPKAKQIYDKANEQLDFDVFKTKHIVKKIKRKTFSFSMNVLSIFTDLDDDVKLDNNNNIDCISIYDEDDLKKYKFIKETFPDINKKMDFTEDGFQL